MFQSPFGGVSMFLNILIVLLGSFVRFLSKRSKFVGRMSHDFFSQFSDMKNDTLSRRIFAFTIPLAMFVVVLVAIGSAFLVLVRDDKRIPAYQLPVKTFDYLSTQAVPHEFLPIFSNWVIPNNNKGVVALSGEESNLGQIVENTTSSSVVSSAVAESPPMLALGGGELASNTPAALESETATATIKLIQFLEKNNIDSSKVNRIEIAKLLKIPNYTGTPTDDTLLLKQLQELSARTTQ